MIQDEDRGHSWTTAFLGLRAKEIHLCGDSRSLEYISKLVSKTGDTVNF